MIKASHQLGIDLHNSILIGDKQSDIDAARAAGVGRAYIISSDNSDMSLKEQGIDGHYSSLLNCATHILT